MPNSSFDILFFSCLSLSQDVEEGIETGMPSKQLEHDNDATSSKEASSKFGSGTCKMKSILVYGLCLVEVSYLNFLLFMFQVINIHS